MRRALRIPPADQLKDDTPLRLDIAAALAFPDGSVSGASLRREADRGRLEVEVIAGKLFTSLRAIREMRERCRVHAKVPDCTSEGPRTGRRNGSSSTEQGNAALARLNKTLKGRKRHSKNTRFLPRWYFDVDRIARIAPFPP